MLLDEYGFPIQRAHVDNGDVTVETIQDTHPIIERNKKLQNDPVKDDPTFGRLVASIPLIFVHKWLAEDGVNVLRLRHKDFMALVRKKINDPDYKFLRTTPGRV